METVWMSYNRVEHACELPSANAPRIPTNYGFVVALRNVVLAVPDFVHSLEVRGDFASVLK
jgi:hypothetical protein